MMMPFFNGVAIRWEAGEIPQEPTDDALWAWHDASDVSTLITESGGRVTNWADKSGNGRFVFQNSGNAARPYSGSRMLNGLNVLDFQGAQRLAFDSGVYLGAGASTAMFVYQCDTTGYYRLFSGRTPSQSYALNLTVNTALPGNIIAVNHHTSSNFIGVAGTPDAQPHIGGWRRDGSVVQALVDGVLGNNGAAAALGLIGNMFYACRLDGATPIEHLDGVLAEALFYDKALTAGEIALNTAYLQEKWGL